MSPIEKFIRQNSAFLDPGIVLAQSSIGGYGIKASKSLGEGDVVLRVPLYKVLDIHTLLHLRSQLHNHDTLDVAKKLLQAVLRFDFDVSETMIIWCHLCALLILRNDPGVDLSPVQWIVEYLDVLLSTEILDVDDLLSDSTDALVHEIVRIKANIRMLYEHLIEIHPPAVGLFSIKDAFQLFQAVRSRVLEIPCETETGKSATAERSDIGEGAEITDNNDDFETNVSLVPMLDFANHSFDYNAAFDVDRKSKDVILRLVIPVEKDQEITISYSPLIDDMSPRFMNLFFVTYGFLPMRGFYSWRIENVQGFFDAAETEISKDFDKIAQWLRIPLEIIFETASDGSTRVNQSKSLLPLLFIPGLEYNNDWPLFKDLIYSELSLEAEGTAEDIVACLEHQETSGNLIYGLSKAYGVLFQRNPIELDNIVDQTGCGSEEMIDALELKTTESIVKCIKATLDKGTPYAESLMLKNYYEAKLNILRAFLSNSKSKCGCKSPDVLKTL